MNVLVLATDVFKKGGIQRYTRYQIQALKENLDFKNVFVFSLLGKDPKNSFEEDILLDYSAGGIGLFSKMSFAIKVFVFLRKENINLIICNHASLSPIAFFAKKIMGVRYLVNVYGLEIWSGLNWFKSAGLKNADGIIGISKFTLSYLENNLKIKPKKAFLLYPCVDSGKFFPLKTPDVVYEKYGIPKGKKMIVTVGRLDRDKGQKAAIKCLKMLSGEVFYVIVGDGIKRAELEKLAENEGVKNRVIFTGRVPEEDLIPLYNIGDIFLLIGKFDKGEGEGFGFVLIEASACAKPVIGGNEDGSIEAVLNGESGFSLSPRDFSGIVQKIRFLIDNPELAEKMGKKGRKFVEENFSREIFQKNQSRIIKDILGNLSR